MAASSFGGCTCHIPHAWPPSQSPPLIHCGWSVLHFSSLHLPSWIDDGKCNEEKWRTDHPQWIKGGDCDGGHAWGMWQVHPPNEDAAIGHTYVADRKVGIRAALTIARASLQAHIGLCHYSGETFPKC